MDEHYKISVIVPVYNAEKYLRECLDSLINQDLPKDEYEIILVNDGSTDGSLLICEEYAGRYCCIKLFSQENQGVSVARNVGIQHALGEYVMFVDADDYVKRDALKHFVEKMIDVHAVDILLSKIILCKSGDTEITSVAYNKIERNRVYSGEQTVMCVRDFSSACGSCFRREFLVDNRLFFTPHITRGEDSDFVMRCLALACGILLVDFCVYFYRFENDSATRTCDVMKLQNNFKSNLMVVSSISHFVRGHSLPVGVKTLYQKHINSMIVSAMISLIKYKRGDSFAKECIDYIYSNNLLPVRGTTLSWKTTMLVPFINAFHRILL